MDEIFPSSDSRTHTSTVHNTEHTEHNTNTRSSEASTVMDFSYKHRRISLIRMTDTPVTPSTGGSSDSSSTSNYVISVSSSSSTSSSSFNSNRGYSQQYREVARVDISSSAPTAATTPWYYDNQAPATVDVDRKSSFFFSPLSNNLLSRSYSILSSCSNLWHGIPGYRQSSTSPLETQAIISTVSSSSKPKPNRKRSVSSSAAVPYYPHGHSTHDTLGAKVHSFLRDENYSASFTDTGTNNVCHFANQDSVHERMHVTSNGLRTMEHRIKSEWRNKFRDRCKCQGRCHLSCQCRRDSSSSNSDTTSTPKRRQCHSVTIGSRPCHRSSGPIPIMTAAQVRLRRRRVGGANNNEHYYNNVSDSGYSRDNSYCEDESQSAENSYSEKLAQCDDGDDEVVAKQNYSEEQEKNCEDDYASDSQLSECCCCEDTCTCGCEGCDEEDSDSEDEATDEEGDMEEETMDNADYDGSVPVDTGTPELVFMV